MSRLLSSLKSLLNYAVPDMHIMQHIHAKKEFFAILTHLITFSSNINIIVAKRVSMYLDLLCTQWITLI